MQLKVLGTQSPYNTLGHNCPGFLITDEDTKIMIDCGSGSHSLLHIPNDLNNLSILISHLHRDHYNDIYNMQYSSFVFHNQNRIKKPIDIYLPSTPSDIYQDLTNEQSSFANYTIINENKNLRIGNIKVSFCQTHHPVETYAIKLSNNNKSIVYTSDTSYSCKDKIIDFAQNTDLLICESSLLKSHGFPEINSHLTAHQAGTIAQQANASKLLLTHFWPEEPLQNYVNEAKTVFANVTAATEGLILDLNALN